MKEQNTSREYLSSHLTKSDQVSSAKKSPAFSFRNVEWTDRDVLWDWWLEPLRRIAVNEENSITYEQHCVWLRKLIKDQKRTMFIGLLDNLRIGLVRFDNISEMEYEITAYLKPAYCGREFLPEFLRESGEHFCRLKALSKFQVVLDQINGEIVRIFLSAGYSVNQSSEESTSGKILLGFTS